MVSAAATERPSDRAPALPAPRLRVGFVLLPEFTLLPFAGMIDVLRLAADEGDMSRQTDCRWTVMAADGAPVRASCGTAITPDADFGDPAAFDYVVVCGGLLHRGLPHDATLDAFLLRAAARRVPLVGLCTAVFTLIRLGLMSGRRACVSWYHYWDLVRAFPDVTPIADQLFVVDRDRITCAGGTGAVDLAAWLVARHLGEARAQKATQILLADRVRPAEAPQPHIVFGSNVRDARLRRALSLIEQSVAQPPTMDTLAEALGLSRRQLERLFRRELGVSPSAYQRRLRIQQGHWLLTHTNRPVTEIAYDCGFADASHFSRQIKTAFGASPQAIRAHARAEDAAAKDAAAEEAAARNAAGTGAPGPMQAA